MGLYVPLLGLTQGGGDGWQRDVGDVGDAVGMTQSLGAGLRVLDAGVGHERVDATGARWRGTVEHAHDKRRHGDAVM